MKKPQEPWSDWVCGLPGSGVKMTLYPNCVELASYHDNRLLGTIYVYDPRQARDVARKLRAWALENEQW